MPRSKQPTIEGFAKTYCLHTKGRFAGQPFELLPWQKKILKDIFETLNSDGTRQYRTAYIEVAKKNGKTQLAALIGLYMLVCDREPEAEVYSCAVDREQAGLCFKAAKSMVQANPRLSSKVKVLQHSLEYKGSTFSPRARDAKSAHGINPSCLILDELHVFPGQAGRDYFDTLTAGTVNRTQPLTIMITTAGNDQQSVCWQQREYAHQVREGIIKDDTFYSYVASADKDEDWTDPKVWAKANPSLGHTIMMKSLKAKCEEAKNNPAKQNAFRQLHLSQWVQQASRWLDLTFWDKCDQAIPDLTGRKCYGELDLASTRDLTAFVLIFPPEGPDEPWWVIPRFWLPEDGLREKGLKDQVPYLDWVRDGFLDVTPGNVTDYDFIESCIVEATDKYDLVEVGFDDWNANQVTSRMYEAGIEMVKMRQGHRTMGAPTKELERKVLGGTIAHGGHPVLRWNADNMIVRLDPNGNVCPDKGKARQKIDGIVALIMAIGRAIDNKDDGEYENPEDAFYFG
jgi:phage terminase large subunit-like protein